MLFAQGAQQPQGQLVSGQYVKSSPLQFLNNIANQYAGLKTSEAANQAQLDLAAKIRENKNAKEQEITNLITGTPETTTELAGPYAGNVPMPTAVAPATQPNLPAALKAINTNNPYGAGSEYKAALVSNFVPKKTDEMLNFEVAKADGFKGSFTDYKNKMTDYQKAELGLSGARLNLEQQKAAFEMQNGKPLNESQGKAAVFHSQMVGANNELNNVYAKGFNPNNPAAQAQTSMAGGIFNFVTPAAAQQAKQAQNQWTEAYLRFKTGAGTNAHEIEANRKTYFPDVGDSPAVIQQKARMREQAQNDIAIAAGPQGARLGVQASPTAPVAPVSPAPTQQATPSLWGQAEVVK